MGRVFHFHASIYPHPQNKALESRHASTYYFAALTVPMAAELAANASGSLRRTTNPLAVVDRNFCLHDTNNLFVVDASVMPAITSANSNMPTLMLAEMAADRV